MAFIVSDNKKQYEKPESGAYNAVLVDTVDLGIIATKFGNKAKVRIVWVLGKLDGSGYAVDSEGNPFRVMSELNATTNEKSDLFKLIRGVLGAAPPAGPYDIEQLIGRNNQLFIVKETTQTPNGEKTYANVKGILPYPAGLAPLPIPPNFVRHKDRDKGQKASPVLNGGGQVAAAASSAPAALSTAAAQVNAAPVSLDKPVDKDF